MSVEHLLESDEVAYRTCSCRHCPEIAIGPAGAICGDCEEAGCTADGCEREDEIFAELFPEEVTCPGCNGVTDDQCWTCMGRGTVSACQVAS